MNLSIPFRTKREFQAGLGTAKVEEVWAEYIKNKVWINEEHLVEDINGVCNRLK